MINLTIASNNKDQELVELNDVKSVSLPTETGIITIMRGHMNLMSLVKPGEIVIKSTDYERTIKCGQGIVYADIDSNVRVLLQN